MGEISDIDPSRRPPRQALPPADLDRLFGSNANPTGLDRALVHEVQTSREELAHQEDALPSAQKTMEEIEDAIRATEEMIQTLDSQLEALEARSTEDEPLSLEDITEFVQTLRRVNESIARSRENIDEAADPLQKVLGTVGGIGFHEDVMPGTGLVLLNLNSVITLFRRCGDLAGIVAGQHYLQALQERHARITKLVDTLQGEEREAIAAEAERIGVLLEEQRLALRDETMAVGLHTFVAAPSILRYFGELVSGGLPDAAQLGFAGVGSVIGLGVSSYQFHEARIMVRDHRRWVKEIAKGRATVDFVTSGSTAHDTKNLERFSSDFYALWEKVEAAESLSDAMITLSIRGVTEADLQHFLKERQSEGVVSLDDLHRADVRQAAKDLYMVRRQRQLFLDAMKPKEEHVVALRAHIEEQGKQEERYVEKYQEDFDRAVQKLLKRSNGDLETFSKLARGSGIDMDVVDEILISNKQDRVRDLREITEREPVILAMRRLYLGRRQALDMSLRNGLRATSRQKQSIVRRFLRVLHLDRGKSLVFSILSVTLFVLTVLATVGVIAAAAPVLPYIAGALFVAGMAFSIGATIYMYRRRPNLSRVMATKDYLRYLLRKIPIGIDQLRLAFKEKQLADLQRNRAKDYEKQRLELRSSLVSDQSRKQHAELLAASSQTELDWEKRKQLHEEIKALKERIAAREEKQKTVSSRLLEAKYQDYLHNCMEEGISLNPDIGEKVPDANAKHIQQEDVLNILVDGMLYLAARGELEPETVAILNKQLGVDIQKLLDRQGPWVDELRELLKEYFAADESTFARVASREVGALRNEGGMLLLDMGDIE